MNRHVLSLAILSLVLLGCERTTPDQSNISSIGKTETSLQIDGAAEPSNEKCCECSEEVNLPVKSCGKGCNACAAGKPEECECKTAPESSTASQ